MSGSASGIQTVALSRGARIPHRGGTLVLAPSPKAPHGLIGVVISVKRVSGGRALVKTRPGNLQDAYKSFDIHMEGTLGQLVDDGSDQANASSALGKFAPPFRCKGPALRHTVTTRVDLSHVHATLDVTSNPSINFLVAGTPEFNLDFDFSGRVTCEAAAKAPIPIADTGLVLKIGPKFSFTASGAIGAHLTWAPRFTYGFFRSRSSGNQDTHVFVNQGGVNFNGQAGVTLGLALDVELTLADRVGVEGTIGPEITGKVDADAASAATCFDVDAEAAAALEAHADVLFTHWVFQIGSLRFGHVQLLHSCSSSSPPPPMLPQVRAVMNWDSGSDIDLYTWDEEGDQTFYMERYAIPNAELVEDIIPSEYEYEHPPEVFQETAEPNRHYTFGICDYRGEGAAVTLTVTDPGGGTRTYQRTLYGVGDGAVITTSPQGSPYAPPEGWCNHIEEYYEEPYEGETYGVGAQSAAKATASNSPFRPHRHVPPITMAMRSARSQLAGAAPGGSSRINPSASASSDGTRAFVACSCARALPIVEKSTFEAQR